MSRQKLDQDERELIEAYELDAFQSALSAEYLGREGHELRLT